jgi:hypothetical protein
VIELLGIGQASREAGRGLGASVGDGDGDVLASTTLAQAHVHDTRSESGSGRWDAAERQALTDHITARRPFLDLLMHRLSADGSQQAFRISGEPMFDRSCRFTGYRGLGVEVRVIRQ